MDELKQPGIKFVSIHLVECHLVVFPNPEEMKAKLDLGLENGLSEDGDLLVSLTVRINEAVKNGPFTCVAKFIARFEQNSPDVNMPFEEFSKVNAPALMFPYVREFLTNISGRTPYPALMLPPINLKAIEQKVQPPPQPMPEKVE